MNRILVTLFLVAGALRSQTAAFEAVSIKPAAPDRRGMGMNVSPGRIRIINSSLKLCIQMAWDVREFQVSGATGWMDTERYDIDAVAADRFKQDDGDCGGEIQTAGATHWDRDSAGLIRRQQRLRQPLRFAAKY